MKTTRSRLSVVVVSLVPLMNPGVSQAFTETVLADTTVSNETVDSNTDTGSTQQVYGTATDTTVNTGGQQVINPGGATNRTSVNTGGTLTNNGGEDNNTTLNSGGTVVLQGSKDGRSVAVSNNAVIAQGSFVNINDYAEANRWIINGTNNDYIYLRADTSVMNDATLNGGKLWIEKGTLQNTTVNGGQFVNVSGTDYNTVINSGIYYLGGASVASSYNLTINAGAYANLNSGTITDATINGSLIVAPNFIEPSILSSLQGNIAVNDGGRLTIITGSDTASADYTVSGSGEIALSTNASAIGTYEFALGNVVLDGGSITYDRMGYSSLTLSSLAGSGSFYLYTNIASSLSDYLDVTGTANGSFNVWVSDTGVSPETSESLKLIQTGGGDAVFTLANTGNVVDLGTYQYHLVAGGNDSWWLTPLSASPEEEATPEPETEASDEDTLAPETGDAADAAAETEPNEATDAAAETEPDEATDAAAETEPNEATDAAAETEPETGEAADTDTVPEDINSVPSVVEPERLSITPSTAAVLAVATADPLLLQLELEIIGARLAEQHLLTHESGVWGTVRNSRLNVSDKAGADYWMSTNAIVLGADRSNRSSHGLLTQGVFFSQSHSDMHFRGKGTGGADVDAYAGGIYAAWQHDSGYWLDGILKLNRFRHDIDARMTSGTAVKGRFSTTGVGAALKGGHDFHPGKAIVTPYISLTGITVNSASLALNNGMKARIGSQKSLLAAAGVTTAYPVTIGQAVLHPYIGARVERETVKTNRVWVNGDRFTNDLSGTRGVYHAGVHSQLTSTLAMQVNAGYQEGSHIESPWSGQIGMSWQF